MTLKRILTAVAISLLCGSLAPAHAATPPATSLTKGEPDYSAWNAILKKHYDPRRGMNYRALKAGDMAALGELRQRLGRVDVASLNRNQQLAYWINLYNVNVVATVAEKHPIKSIRALSTDPVVRLNIFNKELVPFHGGKISLNTIENKNIREGFKDARIHFAINCAALSCPPIRESAYTGAAVQEQLDAQTRKFLDGPMGARVSRNGSKTVVKTTKIMKWFDKDFDAWGGGRLAFIRKYVSDDKRKMIDAASGKVSLEYDDYNWDLNDAR